MLYLLSYLELHIQPSLEVGMKERQSNALVRKYTLSDPRESNEEAEQSFVYKNLFEKPQVLTVRTEVTQFTVVLLFNYPR